MLIATGGLNVNIPAETSPAQSVFPPLPPWSSRSEELYPYEGLIRTCLQLPAGFVSLFSILTTLFLGGKVCPITSALKISLHSSSEPNKYEVLVV